MYIKNSVGDSGEPWGTLHSGATSTRLIPTSKMLHLLDMKLWTHEIIISLTPLGTNFSSSPAFQTESYDAWMSRATA